MIPSLEGLPTKAKEASSPHELRLAPLDTNPVFHSLGNKYGYINSLKRTKVGELFRVNTKGITIQMTNSSSSEAFITDLQFVTH